MSKENLSQSRGWLLTQRAEDYTQEQIQEILKNYIYIGQKEKGEQGGEYGYEHYQIYIENDTPIKFNTLKNKLPNAHIEPRKGTRKKAYKYCTKEDTRISPPFSNGVISLEEEKGRRNDLIEINALVEMGASNEEIRNQYPSQFMLYRKHINDLRQDILQEQHRGKRRLDIQVNYISGKTGSGKTSFVLDKYGDKNVFIMSRYPRNEYEQEKFDGYNGEDVILFDEFRSQIRLSDMLRYLDVYYCDLPARNQDKVACYTKIYITSNWTFNQQYRNIQEKYPDDWKAFCRRVHNIYDFDVDKKNPIPKGYYQQKVNTENLQPIMTEEKLPF